MPEIKSDPRIALSIIIRVVGGGRFLHRCLERLAPQVQGQPFEILVPYDSTNGSLVDVQSAFPTVKFLDLGIVTALGRPGTLATAHEMYDRRTTAGLTAARGDILASLEDFAVPDPNWC